MFLAKVLDTYEYETDLVEKDGSGCQCSDSRRSIERRCHGKTISDVVSEIGNNVQVTSVGAGTTFLLLFNRYDRCLLAVALTQAFGLSLLGTRCFG